jgi:drug/metabolite transporter (DMT)-like permease
VLPPAQRRARGYSLALGSALALSTTAILIRHLTGRHQLPAAVLSFWRAAVLVAVLAPALAAVRPALLRPRRSDLRLLGVQGLVLAAFNLAWTSSVARCGAALATVLVYTSGAFTALLGAWLLRERLGRLGLWAVGLCLGGCTLVSGVLDGGSVHGDAAGAALGLLSGALYALYTVLSRTGARRGVDPWTLLLSAFAVNAGAQLLVLAAGPALVPGAPGLRDLLWLGASASGWAVLAGLAAGPTLLGFGLFNLALRHLPSGEAGLVVTVEPALTAVQAYALLGERLSALELAGSAVLLLGVVLLGLGEGRLAAVEGGRRSAGDAQARRAASRWPAWASTSSVLQKAKRIWRRRGSGAAWKLDPGTPATPCSTTSRRANSTSAWSERAE